MNSRLYQIAKRKPEVRQGFLEDVDFEEHAPFVGSIEYIKNIHGNIMSVTFPLIDISNLSTVKVSNMAFDRFSYDDFYNSLVHHEGFHTTDWRNNTEVGDWIQGKKLRAWTYLLGTMLGLKKFKGDGIQREIRAYENQIKHESFSRCSEGWQKEVHKRLGIYQEGLQKLT